MKDLKRSKQSFAACDDGGEGDFFSCLCVEGHAALAVHRVCTAGVGDAEEAEADHVFIDASPLRDDGVVEVSGLFEKAAFKVAFFAFIGKIEALFCILRFLFAPSIKTVCESSASFAVDAKDRMAAVGHALAGGVAGFKTMVFDDEP